MNNALSKIDSDLGGPRLQQQDAAAFEKAWQGFQLQFDPNARESKGKIDEIAKLLDITGDNLEQVKNQKWFQRAWGTVSGKNKQLARINSENLLRVQKGAFFFLEGLAAQNQMMMQAVIVALQRVEDNQIQNERLKAHLLQVVRRYNDRIRGVESRQDHLEQRLAAHEASVARPARWLVPALALVTGVLGVLMLGGAVVAWALAPGAVEVPGIGPIGRQAITASLGAIGTILSVAGGGGSLWAIGRRRSPRPAIAAIAAIAVVDTRQIELDRIRRENARARPRLARELLEVLVARYSGHASSEMSEPVLELLGELDSCFEFGESEPSSEQVAQEMKRYLDICADVRSAVRSQAQSAAGAIWQDFNQLVGSVVEVDLNGDLGVKLATEAERSLQTALGHDLCATLDAYDDSIANVEAARGDLLGRYRRWRGVFTEGAAYGIGKALLKGFLIVPAILDDEPDFMKDFQSDLGVLDARWSGLRESLAASLNTRIEAAVRPFVSELAPRLDRLFDACDEEGVALTEVEATISAFLSNEEEQDA